jgi:hypothetical protein
MFPWRVAFLALLLVGSSPALAASRSNRCRVIASLGARQITAIKREIRAEQKDNKKAFLADARSSRHRPAIEQLPEGLEKALVEQYGKTLGRRMYEGYDEVREFMADHKRVFSKIQELELAVGIRTAERQREQTPQHKLASLLELLEENEKAMGFRSVVEIKRRLSQENWMALLAGGAPFLDNALAEKKAKLGVRHGILTHRIQLYLWSREIAARFPQKVKGKSMPYLLYTELGNAKTIPYLNWEKTKYEDAEDEGQHLWGALFDAFGRTFSSPEYFLSKKRYFPGLGAIY